MNRNNNQRDKKQDGAGNTQEGTPNQMFPASPSDKEEEIKKRIEELEYVLGMYEKTITILEVWNIEDLKSRIENVKKELSELKHKEKIK